MSKSQNTGHFPLCPNRKKDTFFTDECQLCEMFIYIGMAIIAALAAYVEYNMGTLARAYSPRADAIHLANDCVSDIVSAFIAFFVAREQWNENTTRLVGAYIQAGILVLAAIFVLNEALERYLNPGEVDWFIMVQAGIVGFLGNTVRLLVLNIKKGQWSITRFIQDKHTKADLLGSIGVVLVGITLRFLDWHWLDLVCALGIFLYLGHSAFISFKKAWNKEIYDTDHNG